MLDLVARRKVLVAVAICALAGAASLQAAGAAGDRRGVVPAPPSADAAAVGELPLSQLVGQHVIASYNGSEPPAKLFRLIEGGKVAGVIFFGGNINEDKDAIREVVTRLQEAREQASSAIARRPLLMMTDQEGGEVRRLPGAPARSQFEIGNANYTSGRKAGKAGIGAGENLASVGMNVNLAPILGVQRSRGGFLGQFERSYGPNRRRVSRYGAFFIDGIQSTGVAATSKHFPGLGAARRNQDTDVRPVTIRRSRWTMKSVDMFPYTAAIEAGTDLVMLNHARYPALDRSRPASLSRSIVRGQLRRRLGFDGVTITDALEAGALEGFGATGRRAILATEAGNDLVLASSQDVRQAARAGRALRRAVRSGRLDRDAFERAAARVASLRAALAG